MSRSFVTFTNDWELLNTSKNFSRQISLSPETYGVTAAEAAEYAALQEAFALAMSRIGNPSNKSATLVLGKNEARAPLVAMASRLAKRIDGVAELSDQQRLNLGLSVRGKRSPLPPPGQPDRFALKLLGNGWVELSWKCSNPRGSTGTLYHVYRKINHEPDYTYLQSVGTKRFTDTTLPEGATNINYRVQAVRSTVKGAWSTYDVLFDVPRGSGMNAMARALAQAA